MILTDTDNANATNIKKYDDWAKAGTVLFFSYGRTEVGYETIVGQCVITAINDNTGATESAKFTLELSTVGEWTYEVNS